MGTDNRQEWNEPGKNGEDLEGGRRARRGSARNFQGNRNDQWSDFQPIRDRNDGKARGLRGDDGAYRGTNGTDVRSRGRGRQIGAEVELRPEEDDPQEQRQDTNPLRLAKHIGTKTKLKTEWLRGQGRWGLWCCF